MSTYRQALQRAKTQLLEEVKRLHDKDGLTFQEIGLRLGVTRQRAHQLYKEATDQ